MEEIKEQLITRKCKECHNTFSITEAHANWFKERGLEPPKRCPDCREKKRTIRDDQRFYAFIEANKRRYQNEN